MAYLATAALLLTVAALFPIGGVLFAPFLLALFVLALVGVLAGVNDRSVDRRDPTLDPCRWRGCA